MNFDLLDEVTSAWNMYEEELDSWKRYVMRFHWDVHIVVRKHCESDSEVWNSTGEQGYALREGWLHRVMGHLRKELKLTKKDFHYIWCHEFQPIGNGHMHILLQLSKARKKQLLYDSLRITSDYFYRLKRLKTFYTKQHSKTELSRYVFIQNQQNAVNYVCKSEYKNSDRFYMPLEKKICASAFLFRHGRQKHPFLKPLFHDITVEPSEREVRLLSWQKDTNYLDIMALNSEALEEVIFATKEPTDLDIRFLSKEDYKKGKLLELLRDKSPKPVKVKDLNSNYRSIISELENRAIIRRDYIEEEDEEPIEFKAPQNPYSRAKTAIEEDLTLVLKKDSRGRIIPFY